MSDEYAAYDCFESAVKLGLKECKRSISKGQSGTLPFLEDLIKNVNIVSEVDLGVVDIPLKKIVGTHSYSRSVSFASNFMPLLGRNTEFGEKWTQLCKAHLTEGIKFPIKVYEYLNWFYVVEGNKRVSVLKFFDAQSITGRVTRLIPQLDAKDTNIKIYYEFLEFYSKTRINCIWFSREKSFEALLQLLEKFQPADSFYKDKYKYFTYSIYLPFRKIYHEIGGDSLSITTGDAFLEYARLYGIPEGVFGDDMKNKLQALITELDYILDQNQVSVQTEPEPAQQSKIITSITNLVRRSRKLKVAYAYAGSISESNWTYSHEIGRAHIEKVLAEQVETSYIENVPEGMAAYESLKKLAEDGNDIIFATRSSFISATLKASLEFEKIRFLNCSETHSYKHVQTYFGRIYEPRFLLGMIAGSMTRTNVIGYVARHPNTGIISGINSFALGAKMVNPDVRIQVAWSEYLRDDGGTIDIGAQLVRNGVDIISHQNTLASRQFTREYGLYYVVCDVEKKRCIPNNYIAAPVWNWGIFYEKILSDILNESWLSISDLFGSDSKLVNYWWGMDSGVVDLFYSTRLVPRETQKLVNAMKRMIEDGNFHPFTGPIYDQKGSIKIKKNEVATHWQILNMDWFVDAVETELPQFERTQD